MARLDADAGVVDLAAVTGALRRVLAERGVRTLEGVETTAIERDGAAIRVVTAARGVHGACARRDRRPRHQRGARPAARVRRCRSRSRKDRPSEAKYVVPPAETRERFTARRDAGDRLPRHRDLLPSDRRRGRRRREDRLLQPARHAARRDQRRQHRELRRAVHAGAARRRRSATSRTSTSATTTSSPTTTSCSARSRASRTRSSASAGAAPATSSRRGSGACSPSWRCEGERRRRPRALRPGPVRPRRRHGTMSRPSQQSLEERLAEGVVVGAEGYVFELERRGYVKAGPFVPEVILDDAGRAAPAPPRVPARGRGRDGRADLLRPPREARGRRARRRPRGDEPPGGADRERDRRRGRRARGRQHLQHLVLRRRATRWRRARWCARSTRSSSAGPPRRAWTS